MNNEYKEMLERFDQICQNAKKELLCEKEKKQNDIRHFIIETADFGNFDVVEYKEYLKLKEVLDKIKEYIDNYDVFKEFTFPLMKRDEEQQVLTSIKYEFDTSIKKNLDKLLEEIE